MTLVDTSVWINHFRKSDPALAQLLADHTAGVHPYVLGELHAAISKTGTRP
jgi:predicted nucleic acid-binding protein